MFPFTFLNLYIWERFGYIMLWVVHGTCLGIMSMATTIAYLIISGIKYKDDPTFRKKNIWITLALYLAFQVKSVYIGHKYFVDMVFYMFGTEINVLCDKYEHLCKGFGFKYWWNESTNHEICDEEDDCDW